MRSWMMDVVLAGLMKINVKHMARSVYTDDRLEALSLSTMRGISFDQLPRSRYFCGLFLGIRNVGNVKCVYADMRLYVRLGRPKS